jgi:hypothetical protein
LTGSSHDILQKTGYNARILLTIRAMSKKIVTITASNTPSSTNKKNSYGTRNIITIRLVTKIIITLSRSGASLQADVHKISSYFQ